MKYHVVYLSSNSDRLMTDGREASWEYNGKTYRNEPLDSFEAAQEWLTARANYMAYPVSSYMIQCGELGALGPCHQTVPVPPANPKQAYGDKKLPVHLVPPALVLEVAPNMRDGAEKYGAYNYRNSKVEAMTYIGAIMRHTAAFLDGEDVDPESKSGATHLGAIGACVAILADARNKGMLIDNRPAKGTAGDVIRKAAGVVLPQKEEPK